MFKLVKLGIGMKSCVRKVFGLCFEVVVIIFLLVMVVLNKREWMNFLVRLYCFVVVNCVFLGV